MKKKIAFLLCLFLGLTCAAGLASAEHTHAFADHACTECGLQEAGLYYQGEFKLTWDELLSRGFIRVTDVKTGQAISFVSTGLQGDLIIPEGITEIKYNYIWGDSAFQGSELTSVTFPSTMKSICGFRDSNIQRFVLNEGLEEIGEECFGSSRALTSLVIPASVKEIGAYAFSNCGVLETVTRVPSEGAQHTLKLHGNEFRGSSVKQLDLGNISVVSNKMFQYSALESFVIPEGATAIGMQAFADTEHLHTVVIPDTVNTLGKQAFCNCKALTAIRIPAGVTELRDNQYIFSGCTSLKTVEFNAGLVHLGRTNFDGAPIETLYLPKSLLSITQAFPSGVTVYYEGSDFDWMLVTGTENLPDANIIFNYTKE